MTDAKGRPGIQLPEQSFREHAFLFNFISCLQLLAGRNFYRQTVLHMFCFINLTCAGPPF